MTAPLDMGLSSWPEALVAIVAIVVGGAVLIAMLWER